MCALKPCVKVSMTVRRCYEGYSSGLHKGLYVGAFSFGSLRIRDFTCLSIWPYKVLKYMAL